MKLTERQAQWLGHLYHAFTRGESLAVYADGQGLSLAALLSWERALVCHGIDVPPRHRPARFVAVVERRP